MTPTSQKKNNRKYDLLLLAALAVIGLSLYAFYWFQSQKSIPNDSVPTYYVQVEVNNRVEQLLPLTADGDYTFRNIYSKGENILHIEDGGVSMQNASCPDQVCVYQGVITPPTMIPIVCMPNVVYVSLVERSEINWADIPKELVPEELAEDYAAFEKSR
jgi:hypothetical protein